MVMHIVKVEKQQYEIYQYMVKMGMVGGKIWQEIVGQVHLIKKPGGVFDSITVGIAEINSIFVDY